MSTAPYRRRRDRRGHGMRQPLLRAGTGTPGFDRAWRLPRTHPGAATRAQAFDDLVLDAVELLERRFGPQLAAVEFAVEEVPALPPATDGEDDVPLSRVDPAGRGTAGRVVVYRRPVEARATGREDLADLVLDIVIHQVSELTGIALEELDPEGHGPEDPE